MSPAILIIGGIGVLFLLKNGGITQPSTLTPAQAAQLAAAQTAARIQAQNNNNLGSLLTALLGKGQQTGGAPKSSSGGGPASGGSRASGGSGASGAGSNLGSKAGQCPISDTGESDVCLLNSLDPNAPISGNNPFAPTGGSICPGAAEDGSGILTIGGQQFCEATGEEICTANPGICAPAGGVACFVCASCLGGCSAGLCFCFCF
jgi:hypothetical protein